MKRTVTVTMIALAVAGFAAADQGLTEIGPTTSFPIVIDTPGSYVLTADLHVTTVGVNGIQIDVDNVTLDLGGHVIRGPGVGSASGTGINGYNRENVTIRNGVVTEFANGIYLDVGTSSYSGIRLRDLTVSYCTTRGVGFSGGTARDIVVHNIAYAGGSGNGLVCHHCSISNVTARYNYIGINVQVGSAHNCISISNLNYGFFLNHSTLTGGIATGNGSDGVNANNRCIINGVTVAGSDGWGIKLGANGSNNVMNCTGADNDLGNITGCGNGNSCFQNHLP